MTQKKSYSRYFIILQEDEKGYALASDKLPSGYAKLEIKNDKCKISYYVQNLKKESTPYYMILVCSKKDEKRVIKIGELNIDDHGRAEVCYEYPSDNIVNSTISVDKVTGAAIVKLFNSNIVSVMSGFATTEIPEWKTYPMVEDEAKLNEIKEQQQEVPIEEKVEEKVEEKPEESNGSIFDEYEKGIEEVKEAEEVPQENTEIMDTERVKEENNEDTPMEESGQENENIDTVPESNVEEEIDENMKEEESRHKKDKHKEHCEIEIEEIKKECGKKEHDEKEHECKEYPKGKVGDFFKGLAENLEEMEDICTEIKRCRWYRVPVCDLEDMSHINDYNKYAVIYYPMTSYYQYIKRHDHYMLGYKCDKEGKMKYLVYAIPGTKHIMDQPYAGKSGFVTWVPQVEGDEDEDSFGYWLMFYDFRNSTIVIPVKK